MEEYNDPARPLSSQQLEALRRLKGLGDLTSWRPDILIKVFPDIDVLLFGGYLRDNIAFRWTFEEDLSATAYCSPPGQLVHSQVTTARVSVSLNVPYIVHRDFCVNEALETVIHELCHAILSIFCFGPGRQGDVATIQRHLPQQVKGMYDLIANAVN